MNARIWNIMIPALACACARETKLPLRPPDSVTAGATSEVAIVDPTLPIVEVSFDGGGTGRFLVDTASTVSLMDSRRAMSLGLEAAELKPGVSVMRGGAEVHWLGRAVLIPSCSFGSVTIRGLHAPVLDLSTIDPELTGVFGLDVLASLRMIVIGSERKLIILGSRAADDPAALVGAAAGMQSALRPLPNGWALDGLASACGAEAADGGVVPFVIDTGAIGTALPAATILQLTLESRGFVKVADVTGEHDVERFGPVRVRLGPFDFDRADVLWEPGPCGIIGYDRLRARPFLVDGPARTIRWFDSREK